MKKQEGGKGVDVELCVRSGHKLVSDAIVQNIVGV
jgi:hypothetical protein